MLYALYNYSCSATPCILFYTALSTDSNRLDLFHAVFSCLTQTNLFAQRQNYNIHLYCGVKINKSTPTSPASVHAWHQLVHKTTQITNLIIIMLNLQLLHDHDDKLSERGACLVFLYSGPKLTLLSFLQFMHIYAWIPPFLASMCAM